MNISDKIKDALDMIEESKDFLSCTAGDYAQALARDLTETELIIREASVELESKRHVSSVVPEVSEEVLEKMCAVYRGKYAQAWSLISKSERVATMKAMREAVSVLLRELPHPPKDKQ